MRAGFWAGRHVVYRIYNADDRLLYVGYSGNWPRRLSNHKRSPWASDAAWYNVRVYPTQREALAAERTAIVYERPAHNSSRTAVVPINGHTLRALRQIAGISPRELASRVGVGRTRIVQIEVMSHNRVTVNLLKSLAAALSVADVRALIVGGNREGIPA